MIQHTITTTYQAPSGTLVVKKDTIQGDHEQGIEVEIPGGSVDAEIDINIPLLTMIAIAFGCAKKSGQQVDLKFTGLTIKTNSPVTPNDTLNITPTNGVEWSNGDPPPITNPITANITKLFVSNSGTAIGTLAVRVLDDSTPILVA